MPLLQPRNLIANAFPFLEILPGNSPTLLTLRTRFLRENVTGTLGTAGPSVGVTGALFFLFAMLVDLGRRRHRLPGGRRQHILAHDAHRLRSYDTTTWYRGGANLEYGCTLEWGKGVSSHDQSRHPIPYSAQ